MAQEKLVKLYMPLQTGSFPRKEGLLLSRSSFSQKWLFYLLLSFSPKNPHMSPDGGWTWKMLALPTFPSSHFMLPPFIMSETSGPHHSLWAFGSRSCLNPSFPSTSIPTLQSTRHISACCDVDTVWGFLSCPPVLSGSQIYQLIQVKSRWVERVKLYQASPEASVVFSFWTSSEFLLYIF